MDFPDKFQMTKEQNRRYARMNFTRLVHTNSRFEGINTTLPQTQTIMDGLGVNGVSIDDINTIIQIKRGWQLITESDAPFNLTFAKQINAIVAQNDSLEPGAFRSGQGGVAIGSTEDFIPEPVDDQHEVQFLAELLADQTKSGTEKSLRLMYHLMRAQLFWDGNKRTATLFANRLMIDNGNGLINVPLNEWSTWNTLLSDYYRSNDVQALLKWTYQHAIFGVDLPSVK